MSKKTGVIVLSGTLLALLAAIMQYVEYRYIIGGLSTDIYTLVVAIIFTGLGIGLGSAALQKRKEETSTLEIDAEMVKKLQLNEREHEILQLIAMGLSNQEIADQLFLALPTIKTHISNLYVKLNVKSRTQAIKQAREYRVIATHT
jgi:DNA-binding NarL/FixJ family response regulator